MSSRLAVSRRLAYTFGIVAPLGETVRRWGSWWDYPPIFLDDWLLGALLIAGAWATRDARSRRGRALLAAGWGFACGMAYSSAAAHWVALQAGQVDPAPIPSGYVFAIKVVGLLVAAGALALTLADAGEAPATRQP
ncbi:MAG TPA: hypothetical protein VF121_17255 [Thermoanaerobaculia bacterium]|nr:hypothetical protein [Thermoanaerobaculia bacterium]